MIGIPAGPDTFLKPAIALLAIFGALFGPMVAFAAGLIGHVLTDLMSSGMVWWGWALGSGITGAFMGLIYLHKSFDPHSGSVTGKQLGVLSAYGVVGIVLSLLFSGWFDAVFMGEPTDKLILQVSVASIANIAVFVILGLPAILGYSKRSAKSGNLTINE